MKLVAQIFVTSLVVVKIVLGAIFVYHVALDSLFLEGNAIASESESGYRGATNDDGELADKEAIDLNYLIHKQNALKREKEALEKEKQELLAIKEEINKKIEILTSMRNEIRAENERKMNELKAEQERKMNELKAEEERKSKELKAEMERKKMFEERKLKHLIQAYSTMKPQQAAGLIEKLDIKFAVELLSSMKGDVAGKILSFVDLEKGARISEGLAKRKLK